MAEDKTPHHPVGHHHTPRIVRYALIILTVAFIILCVSFYEEFSQLRRLQGFLYHQGWISAFRSRSPLTQNDVSMIQSWMTFDYVNRIFNIPQEYLRTALNVSDTAYPRITLSRYAKNHALAPAAFLEQVQNAVRAHFTP